MVPIRSIRGRIAEIGVRHTEVASCLEMHPTALSAILCGRREPPAGFEDRIKAVLDRLEAAEQAATRARKEVLAEGRLA